jgi:hypothetical protein
LMYVEVLDSLAWAEHNSGSSKHAAMFYEQALTAVEQANLDSEVWTGPVKAERTAALSHALLGLPLYTLDMVGVANRARSAISNAQDLTRLGKILNRLVRLCTLFGYTNAGAQAAVLAADIAGASRDPEVLAVLCTDIGDFYLHSEPEASKALRDRGLVEAQERRQQLHNEICAAVSDAYLFGRWASESSLDRTTQDARSVGVRNVSARLALYRGVKSRAEGALDLARSYFLDAGQIALLSGDTWIEMLIHHNLAILSLIEGKDDDKRGGVLLEQAVASLISEMPEETAMIDLVVGARARAEALLPVSVLNSARAPLPLLQRIPVCCGSLNVLLYNLERMGRAQDIMSKWPLWAARRRALEVGLAVLRSADHPLVVHHRGWDSILAME